jgi:hypothetical protein
MINNIKFIKVPSYSKLFMRKGSYLKNKIKNNPRSKGITGLNAKYYSIKINLKLQSHKQNLRIILYQTR